MSFINPYWYQSLIPDPDCDPWFDQVSLLLHCEGANNGTTFTDSSQYTHTVTSHGSAVTSTAQYKWGATSLYTDSSNRISVPDHASLDFGDSDFTVEFWARTGGWPTLGVLYSKRDSSGTYGPLLIRAGLGGLLDVLLSTSGSSYDLTLNCGYVLNLNVWQHIAVTRRGNTVRVFVDGTNVGEGTLTGSLVNNAHTTNFCRDPDGYGTSVYMDDIRITKGFARYVSNFSKPTAAFENQGCGGCDSFYDNVSLLLHGDGADGSITFTDSSSYNKSVTRGGNTQIDTAQSKFGGASILFDGSGDYLTTNDHASLDVTDASFTIEAWIRPATVAAGNRVIFNQRASSTNYSPYLLWIAADTLQLYCSTNGTTWGYSDTTCGTVSVNTWHHVALVRHGASITVYLDGVATGGVTLPDSNTALMNSIADFHIGGDDNGNWFNGHIDEVRFTKNVARYTGSFTPPTSAFASEGCGSDPYFNQVVLLLHGNGADGANQAADFVDSSSYSRSAVTMGNVQLDTAQKKYGSASIYFDGVGDRLYWSDSASLEVGSQDFTYEVFIRAEDTPAATYRYIVTKNSGTSGSSTYSPFYILHYGTTLQFYCSYTGVAWNTFDDSAGTITAGVWHHIAFQRRGTAMELYLDGVLTGSSTITAGQSLLNNSYQFQLGGNDESFFFKGWMDEARFTIGTARYAGTFTPPTAPFPDS